MHAIKRIVIVRTKCGGLAETKASADCVADIVLISRPNHRPQPLHLSEAVAAAISPAELQRQHAQRAPQGSPSNKEKHR